VLSVAVTDALREREITPLAPPRVEDLNYEEEGPVTVTAVVEVMPEFEVSGYQGLKLDKVLREVGEEDVDQTLEDLRERTAELLPVERAAGYGDFLIADIQSCDENGMPIIGQKTENRTLQVVEEGEGSEVGRQLAGVEKGEDRRVTVSHEGAEHGAEPGAEPGAGGGVTHDHVFLVQVKEVKEKQLPTLDDEYAKALGDFNDMSDLRRQVREDLEKHVEEEARRIMVGQAIDQLVRKADLEVPESLISRYLDSVVAEQMQAAGDGRQVDVEAIRQQYRGMARMQLSWQMLSARIAEQEGIKAEEEEIRERVNAFAENYRMDPKEAYQAFVQNNRIDRLRADVVEEKVVALILDNAKIKEKKVSPKKQKKQRGGLTGGAASADDNIIQTGDSGSGDAGEDSGTGEGTGPAGSGLIIPGR